MTLDKIAVAKRWNFSLSLAGWPEVQDITSLAKLQ